MTRAIRREWQNGIGVYILLADGTGSVKLWQDAPGEDVLLCDLIISERHRGRGGGRALMERAIQEARLFDASRLVLGVDCEPWVRDWYERLGFRRDGLLVGPGVAFVRMSYDLPKR